MADSTSHLASAPWFVVVLDLAPEASAAQTLDALHADQRLSLASLGMVQQNPDGPDRSRAKRRTDMLIDRCEKLGCDPLICDRLKRSIDDAAPDVAQLLLRILRNLFRRSPLLLIWRRAPDAAPLKIPAEFIAAVDDLFGITVEVLTDVTDLVSRPVRRPAPWGMPLATDSALLNVVTCPDGELAERWSQWLTSAALDDQVGIVSVGPLLQERLGRIGVEDVETARLTGLRRRAWFSNTLMKADSVEIVRKLRNLGIDPVFTGDILSALEAEQDGAVRPIRVPSLLVDINEAARALNEIEPLYGPLPHWVGRGSAAWTTRSKVRLQVDSDRSLDICWRWLRDRSAILVPLEADSIIEFDLDGTSVRGLSPTARFVELYSTTVQLKVGSNLAVLVQAIELIDRHAANIDWEWVRSAFERLDLVAQARVIMTQLPDRVRDLVPILR